MEIRSELYSTNEFTFAVAVILSAQATDKKVNEVTPELFRVAPTPEKMLKLGIDGIKKYISQISFFNNKAKNIFALSEKLAEYKIDNTQWVFPKKYHNRDELMKLSGIGQKTANVIMNVLWGASTIGVDTHVFRNAHRYGWVGADENERRATYMTPVQKLCPPLVLARKWRTELTGRPNIATEWGVATREWRY